MSTLQTSWQAWVQSGDVWAQWLEELSALAEVF